MAVSTGFIHKEMQAFGNIAFDEWTEFYREQVVLLGSLSVMH